VIGGGLVEYRRLWTTTLSVFGAIAVISTVFKVPRQYTWCQGMGWTGDMRISCVRGLQFKFPPSVPVCQQD
jgi:hypothetical protein